VREKTRSTEAEVAGMPKSQLHWT